MSDIFKANFGSSNYKKKKKSRVYSKHKIYIYMQTWEKQKNMLWKVNVQKYWEHAYFKVSCDNLSILEHRSSATKAPHLSHVNFIEKGILFLVY